MRRSVLRPGQAPEQLVYPGDDLPDSRHLAILSAGEIVGIASVMRDGHPSGPQAGDWRVRGMAVAEAHRGRGMGASLLGACEAHVRGRGGSRLWCNARIAARNLYLDGGMEIEGDEFEIPGIGLHLLMSKNLA